MKNIVDIKSIKDISISEVYGSNNIDTRDICFNSDKYKILLLDDDYSDNVFKEIYDIQKDGFITILLYPEKLNKVINDIEEINNFIDAGCLFILDAKSLEGDYGRDIKNTSKILLQNKIYSIIIKNHVSGEAIEEKLKKYKDSEIILLENIERLYNDQLIEFEGRRVKKRKKLLGIF